MPWFWRRSNSNPRPKPSADSGNEVTVVSQLDEQRTLFGRRYVASAPYMLPANDQEINRLDFQHYMLRYALRGNYLAPLTQPESILDAGCGTGRWAMEMARQFPRARVVGLDLVPPHEAAHAPHAEPRPANFSFTQANVLDGLPFADASFDFVHQRLLFLAVPTARWPGVVSDLVRVTRPDGWVELVEGSAVPPGSGPAIAEWGRWMAAASAGRGIDFAQGSQVGTALRDAGLVDVQTRQVRMQAGRQGGRLGTLLEANLMGLLGAVKPQLVGVGVATPEGYDAVVAGIRTDIANGQCFWDAFIAYGQRPR